MLERRFGVPRDAADIGGRLGATVAWGAVGAAFADTFVRGMALYDRVMDPGYDRPPETARRSGGPGSAVEFARTGRQGRRFIGNVPSVDEIAAVILGFAELKIPVMQPDQNGRARHVLGKAAALRSAVERNLLAIGPFLVPPRIGAVRNEHCRQDQQAQKPSHHRKASQVCRCHR